MRRYFFMFVLTVWVTSHINVNSQISSIKESIDSINVILKANPYFDGFNEIAFFYSVNITPDKELLVEMSFDGPFRWIYKAKISDLDISQKENICREYPSSLCWVCKQNLTERQDTCVMAEMIFTEGGSQKENSSNICVSFSSRSNICNDLNRRFLILFRKVLSEK